jgi:predicted metal-dependent hydrolase
MSLDRERDQAGRPRNARPRDELGRPLARGDSGVVGVPDDLVLSPHESLTEAQRLLDEGRPFHAHEVLEAAWKTAPDAERDLWQGLAQLAVGLTHALRGNRLGAATLLRRGADRISGYADSPVHGIDVAGLLNWARSLAGQLDDPSTDVALPTVPSLLGP